MDTRPVPLLRTAAGLAAVRALIETHLRVAGYSDYFTHLGPVLQDEVIARTEHR